MSTFFEKVFGALRFAGHYLWIALKAIGRFLRWLGSWILHLLSNLITWCRYNLSGRAQMILLAVIVALIIVGVALVFTGRGCSSAASDGSSDTTSQQEEPPAVTYDPQESDLQSFSFTPDTITSFSLVQNGTQMYAELSDEDNMAITEALSYLEKDGVVDVGFLIMNLNTGSGYCYNIDERIYGASTYKAPLSLFLCEEYIDGGQLKRSAVGTRIENSIVWSDNNSYRSLKHSYDGSNHNEWLSSLGIDPTGYGTTFPTYSVRDSATIWMHMWEYLNSDTETAEWLGDLLSSTETSFLRTGAIQAGMENATVYNKAGWCASESGTEDAVNDAGIVVDGNNVYLVVAFSSSRDTPTTEANMANLFEALMYVRHDLDADKATWDNIEIVEAPEGEELRVPASDGETQVEIASDSAQEPSSSNSNTADSGNASMAQRSRDSQLLVQYSDGASLLVSWARS